MQQFFRRPLGQIGAAIIVVLVVAFAAGAFYLFGGSGGGGTSSTGGSSSAAPTLAPSKDATIFTENRRRMSPPLGVGRNAPPPLGGTYLHQYHPQ